MSKVKLCTACGRGEQTANNCWCQHCSSEWSTQVSHLNRSRTSLRYEISTKARNTLAHARGFTWTRKQAVRMTSGHDTHIKWDWFTKKRGYLFSSKIVEAYQHLRSLHKTNDIELFELVSRLWYVTPEFGMYVSDVEDYINHLHEVHLSQLKVIDGVVRIERLECSLVQLPVLDTFEEYAHDSGGAVYDCRLVVGTFPVTIEDGEVQPNEYRQKVKSVLDEDTEDGFEDTDDDEAPTPSDNYAGDDDDDDLGEVASSVASTEVQSISPSGVISRMTTTKEPGRVTKLSLLKTVLDTLSVEEAQDMILGIGDADLRAAATLHLING